jgi:hypothetical protein
MRPSICHEERALANSETQQHVVEDICNEYQLPGSWEVQYRQRDTQGIANSDYSGIHELPADRQGQDAVALFELGARN